MAIARVRGGNMSTLAEKEIEAMDEELKKPKEPEIVKAQEPPTPNVPNPIIMVSPEWKVLYDWQAMQLKELKSINDKLKFFVFILIIYLVVQIGGAILSVGR
jgi:hypothetical protein